MNNPYFKDGKMNRDPRPASPVKIFKHGPKQTIKPNAVLNKLGKKI